jgi:hypothetical protein
MQLTGTALYMQLTGTALHMQLTGTALHMQLTATAMHMQTDILFLSSCSFLLRMKIFLTKLYRQPKHTSCNVLPKIVPFVR